ncbi:MAG: TonB-dependent receptor [Prolixibacteraceae bacterium]|nr:TonB-dependent receptor [Prolixibacteraceae bacterium]
MIRITVFFILLGLLQVSASVYSQQTNLVLKLENTNVEQVLKKIEEQSKFYFLYRSDLLKEVPPVSIQVNDAKLEDILNKILVPNGFSYEIDDRVVVIKKTAEAVSFVEAQQKGISGTVKDKNGDPVPGVSVVVKGTTIGTITDNDGVFRLSIPEDAKTLSFSFVGMISQEVAIGGRTAFDVVMQDETVGVEEVVVVGYGTQKKVNLTGAVSAVKIDEKITSRTLTNVSSGLSGMVPGLAVNQNTGMAGKNDVSLLIRGLGTVNNARPLVVVDGMPDVDINRLNMNDIETISVLKDATSSAVYGSRAANGVILITTKSGKGMAKTNINVSSTYAVEVPTKSYEFMADYPRALTLHQRLAAVNTLRSNYTFKDGTIDQWMALGMIDPLRYPNTDWWDVLMRNGEVQNHNISASGGNEKSNFFISVGVMDEKGLQINNDYSRYNARFNYDYKVRDNMNVGARFAGNWSKYLYALEDGFTDDDATNTAGFDLQYAIAGLTPYDPATGYFGGVMAYNEDPQAYNPYTVYVNNLNYQNRQEANTSIYWDWTPIKGLTARIDYALNYYNQFRYTAAIPNRSFNFQTNAFGSRTYVGTNAGVANYTNTGYKTQLNGRLSYETTFAKNHDFSALFVYGEEFWYDRYQQGSRNDRLHPSLHELDAALAGITQGASGNSNTEGLRSYIGRMNYAAFDKYLFEVNFRYDGSSKFLPGSQYGFFPSAALGWRFTEENFLKPILDGILSNGKLRLSYGGLGNNSGVGRYEQQETLAANHYMIAGTIAMGLVNSKMVNPELSWETSNVFNLGFDLGFLNNRLTTELDYYDRLTTGMNRPSEMSILLTGAYNAPRKNIGNLRNRGVEGNFTWKDKVRDFNYALNLNASYNATVLEKWNEFLGRGYTFLNMPYHFLYTYEDSGIAQTWEDVFKATPQGAQPGDILRKDLNGDGRIDGNDLKAYPRIQRDRPTTNFAFSANAAWKGFDLAVLFQGAAGRKDYWINIFNNVNFGAQRYASTWDHWTSPWSVENRNGDWPRLGGNNNRVETTFWLDDLSYLRLKNIQLGYTLPKNWLGRWGIESVRIYGSGENLATVTKFRGLDPEKIAHASDAYPLNKSFSFGINIGI